MNKKQEGLLLRELENSFSDDTKTAAYYVLNNDERKYSSIYLPEDDYLDVREKKVVFNGEKMHPLIYLSEGSHEKNVQELIADEWLNWVPPFPVYIFTPTGSGKNTFIKNILIKPDKKILLISNRIALNIQAKREIGDIAKQNWPNIKIYDDPKWLKDSKHFGGVDICTYQGLGSLIGENVDNKATKYDYVVCDEAHFFGADSEFNINTYSLLKKIIENFPNSIRIYMSATPERIFKYIYELENRKFYPKMFDERINIMVKQNQQMPCINIIHNVYRAKADYSYVEPCILENIDDLIEIICADKSDEKWLIFVNNKEKGEILEEKLNAGILKVTSKTLKTIDNAKKSSEEFLNMLNSLTQEDDVEIMNNNIDKVSIKKIFNENLKAIENFYEDFATTKAVFIHANKKNIGDSKERIDEYEDKLVKDKTFKCKVLISTAILDNGVSFSDKLIKNIVIMDLDKITFLQMLGRKRVKTGEKVNLFLIRPDFSTLTPTKNKLKERLCILKTISNRKYQGVIDEFYNKTRYHFEKVERLVKITKTGSLFYNKLSTEQIAAKVKFYEKILENNDDVYFANKEQLRWIGKYQDGDSIDEYIYGKPKKDLVDFLENYVGRKILVDDVIVDKKNNKAKKINSPKKVIEEDKSKSEYNRFLYDFRFKYDSAYIGDKKSKLLYSIDNINGYFKDNKYELPYKIHEEKIDNDSYITLLRIEIEEENE